MEDSHLNIGSRPKVPAGRQSQQLEEKARSKTEGSRAKLEL